MRIHGLTVCVNYADLLDRGLDAWLAGLDSLLVVTAPGDSATLRLCEHRWVRPHVTEAFYAAGACFDKAGAMQEAVERSLPWKDWVLFFDSDIVPPRDWLAQVQAPWPECGHLYGAERWQDGARYPDRELGGFFHLFHADDPAVQSRPLLGRWHNASGYDSAFEQRWPLHRRIRLPLRVEHLGAPGSNWCGRDNAPGMEAMWAERRRRGGWRHERIG